MVPQLPRTLEPVTNFLLTILTGSHTVFLRLKVVVVAPTPSVKELLTVATGAVVGIVGEGTKARTTCYG